jgi:hypothetical protein
MTTAYNRIDRFLRKHLNDDNYSSYKDELDAICQAKLQRTWVGLTDEEVNNAIQEKNILPLFTYRIISKAIEAKLKEKNT